MSVPWKCFRCGAEIRGPTDICGKCHLANCIHTDERILHEVQEIHEEVKALAAALKGEMHEDPGD